MAEPCAYFPARGSRGISAASVLQRRLRFCGNGGCGGQGDSLDWQQIRSSGFGVESEWRRDLDNGKPEPRNARRLRPGKEWRGKTGIGNTGKFDAQGYTPGWASLAGPGKRPARITSCGCRPGAGPRSFVVRLDISDRRFARRKYVFVS